MRWAFIGSVAIVVFDVVAALAARPLGFEYGSTPGLIVETAINAVPAFLAAREAGTLRIAVLVGAAIAFVNATIGWAASWIIGPGAPADPANRAPAIVVLTVIFVVGMGALIGLIAGLAALGVRRIASPPRD
jgi:hypothetical protein